MRLVVTGHDSEGRSAVVSDVPHADRGMVRLFTAAPGAVAVHTDAVHIDSVPEVGCAAWLLVDISPTAKLRDALAAGVPGIDADGWHTTPTVDFVQILDG
jgi:hypothetical protein